MNVPFFVEKPSGIAVNCFLAAALLTVVAWPISAAPSNPGSDVAPARAISDKEAAHAIVETSHTLAKEVSGNLPAAQWLFVNIDAYGQSEQSKPLGPHSRRRSFAILAMPQLTASVKSDQRGGLVLNLFPDVVVEATKSYVELRSDDNYSWFGHRQDNPEDVVILSVVNGKLAGSVMGDGDLFHIKALAYDSYEITEVDLASFPVERDDEVAAIPSRKMLKQKHAFSKSTVSAGVISDSGTSDTYKFGQREIVPVEPGERPYRRKRYLTFSEGILDWSAWGFNVVDVHCMTKYFTLTHEVGHNLGATHDCVVQPAMPAIENPEIDPWGLTSYGHGYVRHDLKRRSVMAYQLDCKQKGYQCPKFLRFSDPAAVVWGGPFGIPQGQYHAADNHQVLNKNRGLVKNYR